MDYLGPAYAAESDPAFAVLPEMRAPMTQSVAVWSKEPGFSPRRSTPRSPSTATTAR